MNSDEDTLELRQEINQLKKDLLRWEQKFALKHGRKPTIPDIDARPDVARYYRHYNNLKKKLGGPAHKPLTFSERLAKVAAEEKARKQQQDAPATSNNDAESSKAPEAQQQRGDSQPKAPSRRYLMDDYDYPVNHPLSPHRQLLSPHRSPHRNAYKASPSERSSQPTAATKKMVLSPATRNVATEPRTHKHETFTGSTELVKTLRGDQYMDELRNEAFWLDISVEELIERKKKGQLAANVESSTAGQKRKLSGEAEDQVNQQEEEEEVSFKRVSVDIFFEKAKQSASENKSQQHKSVKGKERTGSVREDESNVLEPPKKRRKSVSDNDVEKSDTKEAAEVNKNSISEVSRGAAREEKKQEQKDQPTDQKKRERETDDQDEYGGFSPPKKKYRNIFAKNPNRLDWNDPEFQRRKKIVDKMFADIVPSHKPIDTLTPALRAERQARKEAEEKERQQEEKARRAEEQKEIFEQRFQNRNRETRYREEDGTEIVVVQRYLDPLRFYDPSLWNWDDPDFVVPPGLFTLRCASTAKMNPIVNDPKRRERILKDLKEGKLGVPRKPEEQYIDERLEELKKIYESENSKQETEGGSSQQEDDTQSPESKSQEESSNKSRRKKNICKSQEQTLNKSPKRSFFPNKAGH